KISNSLCGDNGDGSCSVGDRNTKKVRFKETGPSSDPEMVVDSNSLSSLS
ncbi:hypothetical protein J1N35_025352, partial [Gossypium stocksii]